MGTATENRRKALERARKLRPKAKPKSEAKKKSERDRYRELQKSRVETVGKGKVFESVDWDDIDGRPHRVRAVKKISKELFTSCDLDSPQKRLLAERCAFIVILVRNAETLALDGAKFNQSKYVSLVTKLQSMLTVLGLEPSAKAEIGLSGYVKKKSKS